MAKTIRHQNFRAQSGQATIEYLLLLSVIVVAVISFNRVLVKTFDTGVVTMAAELQRNLKTGRASETLYQFN